jgi:hypothetical protein
MQLNKIISTFLMSFLFYGVAFGAPRRGRHHGNEVEVEVEVHTIEKRSKNQKGKEVDVVIG